MENPLLNLRFPIPFDRIRPEHVVPAIDELIENARRGVEELTAQAAESDFENTMRPLDRLTEPLDRAMGVVKHLDAVGSTPELRAAFAAVEPKVSDFRAGLHSNQDLWKRVERLAASDECRLLKTAQSRFLKRWQGILRGSGAGLDAAGKERLAEIQRELRSLTSRFAHNVRDATNAFELIVTSGEELSCMSFPAVRAARASAERKGISGWRFTLQPSSYTAVMREIPKAALREQAYRAYVTRAAAGAFRQSSADSTHPRSAAPDGSFARLR